MNENQQRETCPLGNCSRAAGRLSRARSGFLPAILCLALAPWSTAQGALDPELHQAYQLDIVLDIAKHRLLTPVFADRIEQDLGDELQSILGGLARVTVTTRHPLLEEIRAKGLEKTLEGYKKISDAKTHFVLIDFEDGQYIIRARQHDGMTGMVSPQVRRARTADRRLVARVAASLVELDFGLVGTVISIQEKSRAVEVAIRAGGLGVPLKKIGTGQVFAIAAITRSGGGLASTPLSWALLQVTRLPRDGICECKLYHRYARDNLADSPDVLGYRCLKLGTLEKVPLRLRLLDFKTHAPHPGLRIRVSSTDFGESGVRRATDPDGMVPPTGETYSHVAFVQVLNGDRKVAQIPVALVSPRTVDCPVSIRPSDEAQGQKIVRRERWLRRIYDSLRAAADRVSDLNELGKQAKRQEALDRAREGLVSMANDLKSLNAEAAQLKTEGGLDLSEGEHRLQELAKRRQDLERYTTRLGKVFKEEKDPARQKMLTMVEQARLLETQAEFQQALDIYGKILADYPKETNVRKRRDDLEKAWALKSENHRRAREFLYQVWLKPADPSALKGLVAEARAALKECQIARDSLSPLKLLRGIEFHAGNLKKRFATLRPQTSEDDRKEGATIVAIADDLKKLYKEVTAFLKAEPPAFP